MVKIGKSLAIGVGAVDEDKGLVNKARPPSSSAPQNSQKITERITVVLVRRGYDRQSDTRRILVIGSEMTFAEFRTRVCETLGLTDSYPIRLSVEGVRSAINGGILMGTMFKEAMEAQDNDGVLYIRH